MALRGFDGVFGGQLEAADDDTAYQQGYEGVRREMAWARRHGFRPSERQLVAAVSQALKVYTTARGGKFIGGQRPEWLHGRADALRAVLRERLDADVSPPDLP